MNDIDARGYASPEHLVSTDWVQENLSDPNVRIVESNEDQLLYRAGHIPGAVEVDWVDDLNDPLRRDYLNRSEFEKLMQRIGVTPETCVVFYGDKSNWWACYSLWVFQLFGHTNAKIMDGGSLKWQNESRALTKDKPELPKTQYSASERDDASIRVFRDGVLAHLKQSGKLVDVRSPEEFAGTRMHMEGYPNEGALRGGHIPSAVSVPWAKAIDPETGCFLPASELRRIYETEGGLSSSDDVIAYCRIGERSSLSWFVLKYLLGYQNVRNYDGSWTEWGNLVGVPIEKSA